MRKILPLVLGLWMSVFALSSGCTMIDQLEKSGVFTRPSADISGLRVSGMHPDGIDLLLDLAVSNPNGIGLNLGEVGYHLKVNGQSLVKGNYEKGFKLKSNSTSNVAIPLSFSFAQLKSLSESLSQQETIDYTLETQTKVRVPGLPALPVSNIQKGTMPVPKVPEVTVGDLKVENLNYSSADLAVQLTVNNPNSFSILPKAMNYTLKVNEQQWSRGSLDNLPAIKANSQSLVNIPISVGFSDIGMGMLKLLSGKGSALNYDLQGGLTLDTGLKGLQNVNIPLNLSGQMLTR